MTPEVVRAMIDQAMQRKLTNGDESHSSRGGPTRPVQSVRACSYSEFMKFHINGCVIENQKLEIELWNLNVKGNDVASCTQRFQELALICTKFVSDEKEKVDKYIGGLPDNIHENVMSARPKTLDEAIELANDLMDKKLHTYAERQIKSKMSADDASRNNHGQQ
nr:reverse transcriptase domain-containing protein [Tanacetum cinerariifolium]